jgi:hypothetical protein
MAIALATTNILYLQAFSAILLLMILNRISPARVFEIAE